MYYSCFYLNSLKTLDVLDEEVRGLRGDLEGGLRGRVLPPGLGGAPTTPGGAGMVAQNGLFCRKDASPSCPSCMSRRSAKNTKASKSHNQCTYSTSIKQFADLIFMVTAMTRMTTRMAATTPHRMLMKGLSASPRPSWRSENVQKYDQKICGDDQFKLLTRSQQNKYTSGFCDPF